ncbi:MAG: hypothetical protein K0S37_1678 [Microbacterium sp.]|jgi:hypothetical protein|nr:hypothetical protein [Microbacterium sp.]
MRTRTIALLAASVIVLGVAAGATSAIAVGNAAATSDGISVSDTTGPLIGLPAPLIVSPADLAAGHISLSSGQVLIVAGDDDTAVWPGTGGSADENIARFEASSSTHEAASNAGFAAGEAGTTTAWITDAAGHTTTFDITVAAS